jgi:putative membrane protein insertion efficiency factor
MNSVLHWIRQLVILPIRIYQGTISRITPATCRFRPTCSQYAVEAIQNRGVFVGSAYTLWRLMRCNPFVEGGWDLPPGSTYGCCEEPADTEDAPQPLESPPGDQM